MNGYVVFKTLNETIEKNNSKLEIKNWLSSEHHWKKSLLLQAVDELDHNIQVLPEEGVSSEFIKLCVDMLRANPRIQDLKLFKDENNKFIFLFLTDTRNIGDVAPLERRVEFNGKFSSFKMVELNDKAEYTVPENWKLEEYLTNKIKKYNP